MRKKRMDCCQHVKRWTRLEAAIFEISRTGRLTIAPVRWYELSNTVIQRIVGIDLPLLVSNVSFDSNEFKLKLKGYASVKNMFCWKQFIRASIVSSAKLNLEVPVIFVQ